MSQDRSRIKKSKKSFSGNHQRSWLWGHHAVIETLTAARWPILELFVTNESQELIPDLIALAVERGTKIHVVDSKRLMELVQNEEHQGLVARLGPFPYHSFSSLLDDLRSKMKGSDEQSPDGGRTFASVPLVVLCDRIQDAFNLGAILRCCDGTSVCGVVVGDQYQAEVTPHVVRASSGAVNHVPIIQVANLLEAAKELRVVGLTWVAADSNATDALWKAPLDQAIGLIVGSEAMGVSKDLLEMCKHRICIPMQGQVTSLNVAVATGIMLYEIRRQQSRG